MQRRSKVLLELGRWLRGRNYRFVTPTPATHARVIARRRTAATLHDVFGWSLPFEPDLLPREALSLLVEAGEVNDTGGGLLHSKVRFSSADDLLLVHSAFPTRAHDSVFFGPDTYRYVRMLRALSGCFRRAVDVGAGTGAGLLSIAGRCGSRLLTDINPRALELARVNAALAGVEVDVLRADVLAPLRGSFDLIASNPPFLVDPERRAYRDGGERGIALSVRLAASALPRLAPGGVLVLHTCTPIVDGRDLLHEALAPLFDRFEGSVRYEELEVDVYGEELEGAAYADVDRLAIVSVVARREAGQA